MCDKVVCVPKSARPATQNEGGCHQVPPRKVQVDVTKCHACHAKVPRRHGAQARHQSQPSAISATAATQSKGRCHQAPRLPRRTKVTVTKCHACHAKGPRRHGAQARHQSQPSPISATPATQNGGGCHQVPRLSRETKAGVARKSAAASRRSSAPPEPAQSHKYHSCHVKRRQMSPSATPATQKGRGVTAPKRATRASPVHKSHACHVKRSEMSPSATPAT